MAAKQQLRKRKLEEKLGLDQKATIKSNFDGEILDIAWDLLSGKYDGLMEHPNVRSEPEVDWVFFLIVHSIHASIWAVQDRYLRRQDMLDQDYVTAYDVSECLTVNAVVRRYHVVVSGESYAVQPDELFFSAGKEPEFDVCLYIGTLTMSLKGLDVIMAMIADKSYFLLESDCLEYCKNFVYTYFELIEGEMSYEQRATLRKLTVTTNILSQVSERSGRQNWLSGLSLRSLLTSTFSQVLIAGLLSNGILILFLYRFRSRF